MRRSLQAAYEDALVRRAAVGLGTAGAPPAAVSARFLVTRVGAFAGRPASIEISEDR